MLKILLKLALIIIVALTIAELGRDDPGYILINYKSMIIETSILVVVIFGLLLAMLIAFTLSIVKPFWDRLRPIPTNPKQERALHHFTQGMLALSDGDWPTAQKRLKKLPKNNNLSIVASLGAARAAYETGNQDQAKTYIENAKVIDRKQGQKNKHHLLLVDSQLAMSQGDYGAALRALNKVSSDHQNKAFWKLKARILQHSGQWHQLYALLPKIRQDKLFGDQELLQLEVDCYATLMHDQGLETIDEFWKSIPSKRRALSELAQVRFRALLSQNETALAYEVAEQQIQRGIDSQWALELAKLKTWDWQTRYNLITKYMGNLVSDPKVSKALGLIAQQGGHNTEALDHFKHTLQLEPKDMITQLMIFELEKDQDTSLSPEKKLEIISNTIRLY